MGGGPAAAEEARPKAASATAGLIETANPNAPRKATLKASELDLDAPQELSRRERCALKPARAHALPQAPLSATRRRREAIEKTRAEERHWKLTQAVRAAASLLRRKRVHGESVCNASRGCAAPSQGKTDEAQADLARLSLIKQQREEAAKKRRASTHAAALRGLALPFGARFCCCVRDVSRHPLQATAR